jgi:hypothetical protein
MSIDVRGLLDATTTIYRPDGPEVTETDRGGMKVTHVWVDTPQESDAPAPETLIDLHFFRVEVDRREAESRRSEFEAILAAWPLDATYMPGNRLELGPSYIELGAQIGTAMGQQDAMRLMALGEALGAWRVITPRRMFRDTITDAEADEMAGRGMVMTTGYKTAVTR